MDYSYMAIQSYRCLKCCRFLQNFLKKLPHSSRALYAFLQNLEDFPCDRMLLHAKFLHVLDNSYTILTRLPRILAVVSFLNFAFCIYYFYYQLLTAATYSLNRYGLIKPKLPSKVAPHKQRTMPSFCLE